MKTTNIYVLSDGQKYYIGKADNIQKRYYKHLRNSFNPKSKEYPTKKSQWFRSYGNKETASQNIRVLKSEKIDYNSWEELEKSTIASYRECYGPEDILNTHEGGKGGSGEDNGNAKLSWEDVNHIRESSLSRITLSNKYGVSLSLIHQILSNKVWYDESYEYQIRTGSSGENNSRAKLNWAKVQYIRENFKPHGRPSRKDLAERFGVSVVTIDKVIYNETWYDEDYPPNQY